MLTCWFVQVSRSFSRALLRWLGLLTPQEIEVGLLDSQRLATFGADVFRVFLDRPAHRDHLTPLAASAAPAAKEAEREEVIQLEVHVGLDDVALHSFVTGGTMQFARPSVLLNQSSVLPADCISLFNVAVVRVGHGFC